MKRKNIVAFSVTFVLSLGLFAGAYAALNTSFLAQKPTENASEAPSSQTAASQAPPDEAVTFLLCGLDESEALTDVIMVASLDAEAGEVNVLQIPRDTYVGVNRYPTGKINAVYASHKKGEAPIDALLSEVEHTFALQIDHYATINLPGLRRIVDSMGGVTVDIPQTIYFTEGKTIKKGEQLLTGEKAEWFVRYRKGYDNADIGRMHAQSLFLQACAEKVLSMSRTQLFGLVAQNYQNITTDLTAAQLMGYYGGLSGIKAEDIHFYTLEGAGVTHKGFAVYTLFAKKAADLLNEHFRPYSERVDADGLNIIELDVPGMG